MSRKDVERLQTWLTELADESAEFQRLPWWSPRRWKLGMRLFRRGESKKAHEIQKRFRRWSEKKAEPPKVESKPKIVDPWPAAAERFGHSELRQNSEVEVVIYDLSGEAGLTIEQSRVDLTNAKTLKPQDRFFDVFDQLDAHVAESTADFTLFLEAGSALMELPDDLTGNVIVPRVVNLEDASIQPAWSRDEIPKFSLFSMRLPCILVRNGWLRELGQPRLFHHFFHFAFWHLFLQEPGQTDFLAAIAPTRDLNLCQAEHDWLKAHQPGALAELRDPSEAWDILRHDLVARIVQANLAHFQEQTSYLAAVRETGIRR
ncbi:MAG: hypothetical protein ACI8UO_002232 [Verrucomicrobiales bacterium]|jgi:hypothetical protein